MNSIRPALWSSQYCNADRRGLLVLVISLFLLSRLYNYVVFLSSSPAPFDAETMDTSLTGSALWDKKRAFHDYTSVSALKADEWGVCQGFFALWPSDCVDRFEELDEKMRTLSAQMVAMNSSLTLFVTAVKQCEFPYPSIEVQVFNATELLVSMGFSEAFPIMDKWKKTRFTRISDILRIGLAHKHGKSYLDTDVTFLLLQKRYYERAYAGAALWSNLKNAIEITNAAFCLPKAVLGDMISFQKTRVLRGSDAYFYTELGPSMFHNVLMNRHAVVLYSQNHPAQPSLDAIARDVHAYGHLQLHLTGHVRKGNIALSFGQIVNTIRRKCGLPQLAFLPPSAFAQKVIANFT